MTRKSLGGWVVPIAVALVFAGSAAYGQWTWTPQTKRWINLKNLPKETPELQVEYARSLMLEGDHKRALRETNKFVEFYEAGEFADENQFLRGEIRLRQGKYEAAAEEFQQVVAQFPDSDLYDDVIAKQYEAGDRLYEMGEAKMDKTWRLFKKKPFKRAIQVYGMVIENEPFTDAAAEAQYKVGLCHFTREEYIEAAFEYRHLIESYGNSDWVDDASYGLAECYYEASLPADYDQKPSQLAIAAIDDFAGRFPGDPRNEELAEERVEMRETVALNRLKVAQFYEKRREFDAARICYEVVVEQFGDTAAAETAREWVASHPSEEVTPTYHAFAGQDAAS